VESHDEQFEKYLSEFQPRPPRALPEPAIYQRVWLRRLVAAAAVVLMCGASIWLMSRAPARMDTAQKHVVKNDAPPKSMIALTRLALENPSELDAILARSSGNTLPRFDRPDSALRVLAKE
jgi:hypothetical protein